MSLPTVRLLVEPITGGCLRSSDDSMVRQTSVCRVASHRLRQTEVCRTITGSINWHARRWRRRAHASHLLMSCGKLGLLLSRQNRGNLRHHLCMGNFKFDLDLCPGFGGRAESRFIELAAHGIGLILMQRAHLLVQRPRALAKAVTDFVNGVLLILSKIQIASKWTERSVAIGRNAWCSRPVHKAKTGRRWRLRPLRLLRKHHGCGGEQNCDSNGCHANLFEVKVHAHSPIDSSIHLVQLAATISCVISRCTRSRYMTSLKKLRLRVHGPTLLIPPRLSS